MSDSVQPIDGSPPGSSVHGILQARTLEWVAISSSNAWKWRVKVKSLSRVRLLATPWTAAYQAPPSMGFSRQEYWRGVPLPSPIEKPGQTKILTHSSIRDCIQLGHLPTSIYDLNGRSLTVFWTEFRTAFTELSWVQIGAGEQKGRPWWGVVGSNLKWGCWGWSRRRNYFAFLALYCIRMSFRIKNTLTR